MKFLCVDCDVQMASEETRAPGDGTLAIVFRCPDCEREIAMLANPMETQMVRGLCVDVGSGGASVDRPLEGVIGHMHVQEDEGEAHGDAPSAREPVWNPRAEQRLGRVPGFVRGMVRTLYADWAREHGVEEITLEVMDRARSELGLEDTVGLD